MAKITTWRFRPRSYEVGATALVLPHTFFNYLEEGAMRASAENGYPFEWYSANNRTWVMRKMSLRYYRDVSLTDEVDLHTWIADAGRRVSCFRHYALRDADTDEPIAEAIAQWVFLDAQTMRPAAIPPEFIAAFEPTTHTDLDLSVTDPIVIEEPVIHTEERRVQRREIDPGGHVNNAVYIAWAEQGIIGALRSAGWPPERYGTDGEVAIIPISHEIEYFRSAFDDEPILVITRLAEIGRDRAAWHTEIRHGVTSELMAKDIAIRAFYDVNGPRSIPDHLQLALMKHLRSSDS